MDASQENELFAAAQAGDDQAWSELAHHHAPIMAARWCAFTAVCRR